MLCSANKGGFNDGCTNDEANFDLVLWDTNETNILGSKEQRQPLHSSFGGVSHGMAPQG